MTDTSRTIPDLLAAALERRNALVARLTAEGTDCWRAFHGATEGAPGVAVDRYAALWLVQLFRSAPTDLDAVTWAAAVEGVAGPDGRVVVVDRRAGRPADDVLEPVEVVCHERGMRSLVRARHQGIDPWLFLDLRVARRRLAELAPGRSVLNLFAYTCTAGIAAARAGAAEVVNVDFSATWLDVGRRNLRLNELEGGHVRFQRADCLAVVRHLAGIPIGRRGQAMRHAPPLARRTFELVFLDPPRLASSTFGKVDLVGDYQSLFKPAWLATAPGGVLFATNNVASVERDTWLTALQRCAAKAGRPIRELEVLGPDADFPSPDGRPPLKIAVCHA